MKIWQANVVLVTIVKSALNYLRKAEIDFFIVTIVNETCLDKAKTRNRQKRDDHLVVFVFSYESYRYQWQHQNWLDLIWTVKFINFIATCTFRCQKDNKCTTFIP